MLSTASAYALILTNLAFAPAILLLARLGEITTALVFFGTFTASTLYHACDAHLVCFGVSPMLFRIVDYLFVWRAITWIISFVGADMRSHAGRVQHQRIFLFFSNITYIIVLAGYTGIWLTIIGAVVPLAVVVPLAIVRGQALIVRSVWAIVATVLAVGAAVFFVLPREDYYWSHSLWHVCIALALWAFVFTLWPSPEENKTPRATVVYKKRPAVREMPSAALSHHTEVASLMGY